MISAPADRRHSLRFGELADQLIACGWGLRFVARGQSMLPTIHDGDILHVQPVDPEKLRLGDIVLFKSGEEFKAHRILKRQGECFVTRGDTSMQTDGAMRKDQIIGRVIGKECRDTGRVVRLQRMAMRLKFFAREARRSLALRSRLARTFLGCLLLSLVFSSASSQAQLSIDHSATVSQASISGPNGSYTLTGVPLTVTSQANLLVVGVSFNNAGNAGTAVTGIKWGTQSFSATNKFVTEPNTLRVEIWYLLFPTAGANNVVVTINKSGGNGNRLAVQVGVIDFFGADATNQSAPIRGFASNFSTTASSPSTVTITSANPEIVLDTLAAVAGGTATVGASQTQQWNATSTGGNNAQNILGLGSTKSGASSVTMSEALAPAVVWTIGAISVRPVEADLAITKTAPATVITGANFNYTLTIKNNGPRTATGVIVSDTIPSGVTYVSATPSTGTCSLTLGLLTCSLGNMANGATATVTITVTAGPPAAVTNTGSVSSATIDPDTTNNSSSVTTDIEFSTAVKIHAFSAMKTSGGIEVSWNSAGELHNLGYNIYREDAGAKTRLNSSLIAGSALLMRDALEQHGAKTYKWIDHSIGSSNLYWLEDVDLNGTRTMHGPVSMQESSALAAPKIDSVPPQNLTGVSDTAQTREIQPPNFAESNIRETVFHPQPSTSSNIKFELAAKPAVKIFVDHEGWYRLTQPQLVAAGLPANVEASSVHLYAEGVEQPIRILPEDDSFGRQSAIEFYGTAIDTPYSGERVYWLVIGHRPGLRIPEVPTGSSGPHPGSFMQTRELKPRTTYFAALLREDTDNFFGPIISPTPESESLSISHLAPGEGKLQIALQGVTQGQQHDVTVAVNGSTLGDVIFMGQQEGHGEFPISAGVLTNGSNTITLTAQQGDTDLSLVDTIDISFPHTFTAESDFLKFTADAGETVKLTGFVQAPVRLIDVTNPLQPFELEHSVGGQTGNYSLQASVPWTTPGRHTLLALSNDQFASPIAIAPHRPTNLHSKQAGFDTVILTAPQFTNQLAPLASLHRSEGHSVALVTVDAVYDEFNFGERSPFAIRDFLNTATEAWTTKPHYLLLAGDASLDPRNYLGLGFFDFIPTRILPTAELKTASDDWFSDFENTGLASIATGRLPARTEADAKLMVGKILNYTKANPGAWTTEALMAADHDDPTVSFTQASQSVQKLLPPAMNTNDVFASALGTLRAKQNLLSGLNAGQLLVNYNGHGSVEVWSGSDLFDNKAASSLTNGNKLPFFVIMNCLNGFFQDVYTQSLAESLMLSQNGGAVAVWASSGLTQPGPQFTMNQRLVQRLFSPPAPAIGDAVLSAKSGITDQDVRRTFILFGDPAMHLQNATTKSTTK